MAFNGDKPSSIEDFHDILIIKTDDHNKIIEAYHYTLEWAESLLQFDLYKSDINELLLKDELDINSLRLTKQDFGNENKLLKENGRIEL